MDKTYLTAENAEIAEKNKGEISASSALSAVKNEICQSTRRLETKPIPSYRLRTAFRPGMIFWAAAAPRAIYCSLFLREKSR